MAKGNIRGKVRAREIKVIQADKVLKAAAEVSKVQTGILIKDAPVRRTVARRALGRLREVRHVVARAGRDDLVEES
ncbi:MAG TPA: hypothetical protein VNJ01_09605 [Bacteriovoracaceae bacterium]|nr:hypothetical protein [Bacteriovoracaceae bacterium]